MGDLSGFEKSSRKTSFQLGTRSFLGPGLLEQIIWWPSRVTEVFSSDFVVSFCLLPQVCAALP